MNKSTSIAGSAISERQAWNSAWVAVTAAIIAILLIFRDTGLSLVEIWARSGTFTHCFFVAPISLWLIWRIRQDLASMTPLPHPWTGLLVAGASFAWLLGELATVGVVAQFAFVTMLILIVPAVLGWSVAWRMAFPLLFLYFSVPFGEFAMPQLMAWTAQFTVLGLRLSGIPVYQEGLQFIIPSGSWSVVEACSGVRYILASLTVGTLFAYLNYRSFKRKLVFIGVSLIVPVIANWLRAYMIVMLGHFSGNKLAVGVDHLIYGWVFFGFVIFMMFVIGARWSDETEIPRILRGRTAEKDRRYGTSGRVWLSSIVSVVIAASAPMAERSIKHGMTNIPPSFPGPLPLKEGWTLQDGGISPEWKPVYVNPSAELSQVYVLGRNTVGLYLGYYRKQDYKRKLVSSENTLVKSNDPVWAKVASGSTEMVFNKSPVRVNTAELRAGDVQSEAKRLVVQEFFWVDGELTGSSVKAKLLTALALLRGHGDDSAVVILYSPKGPHEDGNVAIAAFIEANSGSIMQTLDAVRAKR